MTVTCYPPRGDTYDAASPKMVVEVLSPSNLGLAWQRKLEEYRNRDGLIYILLVVSDAVGAILTTRPPGERSLSRQATARRNRRRRHLRTC